MRVLLSFLLLLSTSLCFESVYHSEDCRSCLLDPDQFVSICKSQYSDRVSFCCSENDMVVSNACVESPLCSWNITHPDMKQLTCPHDKNPCGAESPEIFLGMN